MDELDEYDRFLLNALLQQATREAGKPLNQAERQQLTEEFVKEHTQVKSVMKASRRKAARSRKARVLEAQTNTDFQWKPPVPKR